MSAGDLFAAPHVVRGEGFAMQATTHWLRLVPGRTMLGLKAGGLPVELPDVPQGVRHPGIETTTDGHRLALIDVSSHWLRDHADITDRYAASVRPVLANKQARLDAHAKHVAVHGSIELFLGPNLDRVSLSLDPNDGSHAVAVDLLKNAPAEGRTPFAMPPAALASRYDDPDFLAGTQSWIEGRRVLIEFGPEEGGRAETIALDRIAFLDAIERCWVDMMDVAARLRGTLRGAA